MMGNMGKIMGFDVHTDENLVKQDGTKKVKKTFKERLCLKFWERYKEVPNIVPKRNFMIYDKAIYCHPVVFEEVKQYLRDRNEGKL